MEISNIFKCPGLIDMHCHLRQPGQEHKETIMTASQSALAGGFTIIVGMANTSPVVDNAETLSWVLNQDAKVKIMQVGTITKGLHGEELTDFEELKSAGAIALSDDGIPVKYEILKEALIKSDLPIIYHSENYDIGIDESAGEYEDVEMAVLTAGETGKPIHITHISTLQSVEIIRQAKKRGIQVTCDTTPHYMTLTHDDYLKIGANAKMNPPLRSEEDRQAILAGLFDGTIDAIATDHAPHTSEEKKKGANGIVGLETALGLVLRELPIELAIEKMCYGPAKILNIEPIGSIEIDLNETWIVAPEKFKTKGRNTPFAGLELKGKVVKCSVL